MTKTKKVTIEITEKELEILTYLIVKEQMDMKDDIVYLEHLTYTSEELDELYFNVL